MLRPTAARFVYGVLFSVLQASHTDPTCAGKIASRSCFSAPLMEKETARVRRVRLAFTTCCAALRIVTSSVGPAPTVQAWHSSSNACKPSKYVFNAWFASSSFSPCVHSIPIVVASFATLSATFFTSAQSSFTTSAAAASFKSQRLSRSDAVPCSNAFDRSATRRFCVRPILHFLSSATPSYTRCAVITAA